MRLKLSWPRATFPGQTRERLDTSVGSALRNAGFLILMLVALLVPLRAFASFADPLSTPAVPNKASASQPMLAIAKAGTHFVAAGSRGLIIVAQAINGAWVQAAVPVQSDLTDLIFVDATNGWACGHDGVVLHSADGGLRWIKQLDGIRARREFETDYKRQIAAGNNTLSRYLQEVQLNYNSGPWLPWLGIWFSDSSTGYVIGSFGDIAMTNNGGTTWHPWLDHIDNPNFYDLNAIRSVGGNIYIVGEQGSVYKLNAARNKFVAKPTGYDGSLFGLTGTPDALIVFGLRGRIFRSTDHGDHWMPVDNALQSTIVNGWTDKDGRIILVNVDGGILESHDAGKSFQLRPPIQDMTLTSVIGDGSQMLLAGLGGIRHLTSSSLEH